MSAVSANGTVKVKVPTMMRARVAGLPVLEARGSTLRELLAADSSIST